MSNFTCQSKSFISIFLTCQVSACELQPFSCHDLANDIYSQTAKTVFSHLKGGAVFFTRYVKVVPFVSRRYLKEVLFLPKIIFQRERVGPRASVKKTLLSRPRKL